MPEPIAAGIGGPDYLLALLLVIAVLAVFGQTARFGFVNYDDDLNVYSNLVVSRGVSFASVGWAFTHTQVFDWIPLTTLSHMLACQVFGLNAGGHHLINVGLHAGTAVLLFLALRRMTGCRWRSVIVAVVFALHPLRAESVAWVSERKDVLSAFFFVLALGAYVRNVRRPSRTGQAAVAVFFALGLLSKSMVVTLPLVLLLLDYWPLGRGHDSRQWRGLVKEKLALWVLAAAACAVAVAPGLITGSQRIPLFERLQTTVLAYVIYLWQMVFPANLAVGYPAGQPAWAAGLALVILAGISAGVWAVRKTRPYLLVGWLWYVVMLLPVSGIIQISQYAAHADRYTYLPGIGVTLAVTWAVADVSLRWRHRRVVLGILMVAVTGALLAAGHRQTANWRDSETLWRHALACTSANNVAHDQLGNYLATQGRSAEAIAEYQSALAIKPQDAGGHYNYGNVLAGLGRTAEAIDQYDQALAIEPDYLAARINLGGALAAQGRVSEAMAQYRRVLERQPDCVPARYNLAVDLAAQGAVAEAIQQYQQVLEFDPDHAVARNNLGAALYARGDAAGAIRQYQRAIASDPNYAEAHNNLGVALLSHARVAEAIEQYRLALMLRPDYVNARNNLGQALLRLGDAAGALACFQKTTDLGSDPLTNWLKLGNNFLQKSDWADAAACYQEAVRINPRSGEACGRLGVACFQQGQTRAAISAWQQSLAINPDQTDVQNNLAWVLATTPDDALRNGAQALALAEPAGRLSRIANPLLLRTLAAAYAETARFPEAIATARQARELAEEEPDLPLARLLEQDTALYEQHRPLREPPPDGP